MEPIRTTRAHLEHAISRHGGNRAAISRSEGWSLNTVRRLLREHGLEPTADAAALVAARPGPRTMTPAEARATERARILAALAEGTVAEAAATLDMPIATLYRRKAAYGITRDEVEALRQAQPSST